MSQITHKFCHVLTAILSIVLWIPTINYQHGHHSSSSVEATSALTLQWEHPTVRMRNGRRQLRHETKTMATMDRMMTVQYPMLFDTSPKLPNDWQQQLQLSWQAKFDRGEISLPELRKKQDLLVAEYYLMGKGTSKMETFRGRKGKQYSLLFTGDDDLQQSFRAKVNRRKKYQLGELTKILDHSHRELWAATGRPMSELQSKGVLATDYKNIYSLQVGMLKNVDVVNSPAWSEHRNASTGTQMLKARRGCHLWTDGWECQLHHSALAPVYGQWEMAQRHLGEVVRDVNSVQLGYSRYGGAPNPVSATWEGLVGDYSVPKRYHRGKKRGGTTLRKVGRNYKAEIRRLKEGTNRRGAFEIRNDLLREKELIYDSVARSLKIPTVPPIWSQREGSSSYPGNLPSYQEAALIYPESPSTSENPPPTPMPRRSRPEEHPTPKPRRRQMEKVPTLKSRKRAGRTPTRDYSIDIAGRGPRPPPVPSKLPNKKFKGIGLPVEDGAKLANSNLKCVLNCIK